VALRDWLKRLEKGAEREMVTFELKDGTPARWSWRRRPLA
jgi:hypothetical protein